MESGNSDQGRRQIISTMSYSHSNYPLDNIERFILVPNMLEFAKKINV